jgi:hypothetical protein
MSKNQVQCTMVADVSLSDKGHQGSCGCSSAPAWPILDFLCQDSSAEMNMYVFTKHKGRQQQIIV